MTIIGHKLSELKIFNIQVLPLITHFCSPCKHRVQLPVKVKVLVAQSFGHYEKPWTVASQAPLSMGLPWQEYWSGLPFPPPGDLPDPGIESVSPASPAFQADSLLLNHQGLGHFYFYFCHEFMSKS